jgi:predicted MFS family arabinose efflux permease
VIGASIAGFAIRRFGARRVLAPALLGLAAAVVSIGMAPADITVLRILGTVAGMFIFGPPVGVTFLIAERYPVEVRATGTGFIIGVSRWVAAVGPLVGGALMSSGLGVAGSCMVMGAAAVLSAALLAKFLGTSSAE